MSFGMVLYAFYDYSKSIVPLEEPQFYCGVVDMKSNPTAYTPELAQGEAIFKNNCSTCHAATDEVVVGPGLKGIVKRRPIEWIVKWVHNPQKVIKSGDKYALDLYKKFNYTEMTPYPNLKREEIMAIMAYLDNQ